MSAALVAEANPECINFCFAESAAQHIELLEVPGGADAMIETLMVPSGLIVSDSVTLTTVPRASVMSASATPSNVTISSGAPVYGGGSYNLKHWGCPVDTSSPAKWWTL